MAFKSKGKYSGCQLDWRFSSDYGTLKIERNRNVANLFILVEANDDHEGISLAVPLDLMHEGKVNNSFRLNNRKTDN